MLASWLFWRHSAVHYAPSSKTLSLRSKSAFESSFVFTSLEGDVRFLLQEASDGRTELCIERISTHDASEELVTDVLLIFNQREQAQWMLDRIERTMAPSSCPMSTKWIKHIQALMWVLGLISLLMITGSLVQGGYRMWQAQKAYEQAAKVNTTSQTALQGQTPTLSPEQRAMLTEQLHQIQARQQQAEQQGNPGNPTPSPEQANQGQMNQGQMNQGQANAPQPSSPGDLVAQGLEGR